MNQKRIQVPPGMIEAAIQATCRFPIAMDLHDQITPAIIEAAIRWLSENPIVPTGNQVDELRRVCDLKAFALVGFERICIEWQRRMFYAPEPEVPEAVKDLLWDSSKLDAEQNNANILEAYRRGQQSK